MVEKTNSHLSLVELAKVALDKVFQDKSVDNDTILESLIELREVCQEFEDIIQERIDDADDEADDEEDEFDEDEDEDEDFEDDE